MIVRKLEPARHDADDRPLDAAEIDRPSHDVGIAAKTELPRLVPDDDDKRGGFRFVGGQQIPPQASEGRVSSQPLS
jgi:hypothetical protein